MDSLRYPIGQFPSREGFTKQEVAQWIDSIAETPSKLREAIETLPVGALDMSYRVGGWTARQLVHHLADSHMQSFSRFKLALTEENPTIKPYSEQLWAALPDVSGPIEPSLLLIEGLHARWVELLRSLGEEELERTFYHPDDGVIVLGLSIGKYAWHGNHHIAHIHLIAK